MTLTEYPCSRKVKTTVTLDKDEVLRGRGSKQITLTSSADPVIQVASNMYDWGKTAVIENLVIDKEAQYQGQGVGILLQDVYKCLIRNVTIKSCDVGIKITATSDNWSEANNMEYVRMLDVNKGLVFDRGAGTGSFAFTNLINVAISLKDASNRTGIEVGADCKPYSSFMKANVWMTKDCVGMHIDGEIMYGLINFNVEKTTPYASGKGVSLGSNAKVDKNQSFFLAAGNIKDPIYNPYGRPHDIKEVTY